MYTLGSSLISTPLSYISFNRYLIMLLTPKYRVPASVLTIYAEKLVYSTVEDLLNSNVPTFSRERLLRHIHIKWDYPKIEGDRYRNVWLESSASLTQVIESKHIHI